MLTLLLAACQEGEDTSLENGRWRATLDAQGHELPFEFEVSGEGEATVIELINADERLKIEDVTFRNDSVIIPMHIFDATLKAKINGDGLVGTWTKNYYEDYSLAFSAKYTDAPRFATKAGQETENISGRWSTTFVYEGEPYEAIGEFSQEGQEVTGTFLTKTGDYRFLEGVMDGHRLKLSAFDGEHAFLFEADLLSDGTLQGEFWSGSHSYETFTAERNEAATLPEATSLTYLKEGYEGISFSFPGLDGNPVSLDDPKYAGKVVLLQIFGTWCPNCMDETNFLADWYPENKDRGVEIIGLSYERKDDFTYAVNRINRIREKMDVHYDFVVAGTSDKEEASKTLPMLNAVISFPTLIFLDRNHQVRKIHTGFNGPGTGRYYEAFVEEFKLYMEKLLAEEVDPS